LLLVNTFSPSSVVYPFCAISKASFDNPVASRFHLSYSVVKFKSFFSFDVPGKGDNEICLLACSSLRDEELFDNSNRNTGMIRNGYRINFILVVFINSAGN